MRWAAARTKSWAGDAGAKRRRVVKFRALGAFSVLAALLLRKIGRWASCARFSAWGWGL